MVRFVFNDLMQAALDGAVFYDDLPPAVQSCIRLEFYRIACRVLERKTLEERRRMLAEIPSTVRLQIESEVKRIFDLRRQSSDSATSNS